MSVRIDPLETDRFGIVCGKFDMGVGSLADVDRIAREEGIAMVSTRVDSLDHRSVHLLEAGGYRLMDTLVYFENSLRDHGLSNGSSGVRRADHGDADAVAAIAAGAFTGYGGHYHVDPRLDDAKADMAYVDWAHRVASQSSDLSPVFVTEGDGEVVGFLAIASRDAGEAEVVLNAVKPAYQGRGHYTQLLQSAVAFAVESGRSRLIISTQLTNTRVQSVWCRLGFVPYMSRHTFHKWFDER